MMGNSIGRHKIRKLLIMRIEGWSACFSKATQHGVNNRVKGITLY